MKVNDFGGFTVTPMQSEKKNLHDFVPYENKENIQYNFKDFFSFLFHCPTRKTYLIFDKYIKTYPHVYVLCII